MRFESVTAHFFGPFRNQTLQLATGMNIVYGLNESGKSSWHAALQAALCGVRSGKGPPTKQEREFEDRRKPWRGTSQWKVETVVCLADGRRVELVQDLAAKTGRAQDADVAGQDYSAEISEGVSLNGARWLGLNRASFLNTACVRQADVLGVRDAAADLQVALAKAAAKADKDTTVAQALKVLDGYRKNQIGTLLAPTKPRQVARAAVKAAKSDLENAKEQYRQYLCRQGEIRKLESLLDEHQGRISALRACDADRRALEAEERASRVRELRASLGQGPIGAIDDADLADRIAAAIAAWEAAPELPVPPSGDDCEVLDRKRHGVEKDLARLGAATPKLRPKYTTLLLGLGLLLGAGACLWLQTPVMLVAGGICSIAGVAAICWSLSAGKRDAALARDVEVAEATRQLDGLDDQIERRRTADSAYRKAVDQRQGAHRELDDAAGAARIRKTNAEEVVLALRGWQKARRQRLVRIAEETSKWNELQNLLAGQSDDAILSDARANRKEANALLRGCGRKEIEAAKGAVDDWSALLEEESQLRARLYKAKGALGLFAGGVASVADAEDDYESAKRRLRHLETLDQTLATTAEFLQQAQKDVYLVMASVLRDTLSKWLPQATEGRYDDCKVDPKTLLVEVRESQGDWRDASLLSHGTAEQVYLLLRLALCKHLVKENEVCPLILDDPVSACDGYRQTAVLETLLAISTETQVILFTHDDDVRDWGRNHLSGANSSQVLEITREESNEPTEGLGTRIANRFRGSQLTQPFEELRGASIRPLDL